MFSIEIRRRVQERCGGMCERKLPSGQRCGSPIWDFHHCVAKKMGGRHGIMKKLVNQIENCIAVCRGCHDQASSWNEDATDLVPGKEFRQQLRDYRR